MKWKYFINTYDCNIYACSFTYVFLFVRARKKSGPQLKQMWPIRNREMFQTGYAILGLGFCEELALN